MLRKIVGLVMLLFGLSGVALAYMGASLGRQAVDGLSADLLDSLDLLSESLDQVEGTLRLAGTTVTDVTRSLNTVQDTADGLGRSIEETQPLLAQINLVASEQVPDSIESMQEALPGMAQVAGVIDETLSTLAAFQVERRILGVPFRFDLGIRYDPEIPFDESVSLVGASLEGLPEQLRGIKQNLEVTSQNLESLSTDMYAVAADLETLGATIAQTDPLLEGYLRVVTDIRSRTHALQSALLSSLESLQKAINVVMICFGLTQLAPIVLGYEMLRGRRLR